MDEDTVDVVCHFDIYNRCWVYCWTYLGIQKPKGVYHWLWTWFMMQSPHALFLLLDCSRLYGQHHLGNYGRGCKLLLDRFHLFLAWYIQGANWYRADLAND